MTPENFCYWLQGYFELNAGKNENNIEKYDLSRSQISMIQEHLKLVFNKVTPNQPVGILLNDVKPSPMGTPVYQNAKGELGVQPDCFTTGQWSPYLEMRSGQSC